MFSIRVVEHNLLKFTPFEKTNNLLFDAEWLNSKKIKQEY